MPDEYHPRLPLAFCPQCHEKLDAAQQVNGEVRVPTPGDVSTCFYCGAMLCCTDTLRWRTLEPKEFQELPSSMQKALRNLQEKLHLFHQEESNA